MNYETEWYDLYQELGNYVTKHSSPNNDDWDSGYIAAYRDIMDMMDNVIYKEKHKNDCN